jgi:hypothetical protein
MKMIKLLVSTAMVMASPTAFVAPAFATATQAPIANPTSPATLAAMQTQCNALAAAHDLHNGDIWTGEVVDDGVTALVSGPTETGNRVINLSTVVGTGTFTPGGVSIVGDPFRTGAASTCSATGGRLADRGGRVCLNSDRRRISGSSAGCFLDLPIWGVMQGGRSPTGVTPHIGGQFHAAFFTGRLSKYA